MIHSGSNTTMDVCIHKHILPLNIDKVE